MIYEISTIWSASRSLVCPLLPSLLRPSGSASYSGLSLAPGQGHCFITVQIQAGYHTEDSRWWKTPASILYNIKHLQKTIRRLIKRLHSGWESEWSDLVLENQMLSLISSPLNVVFAFMQIFERAFSEHTLFFFRNVPLTTKCSSLRNMFSHLVRKNIMGEIRHCWNLDS